MATRIVVLAVLALAAAPIGPAAAQGLGDAAKKEKARRTEASAQPVKVYTNDNVAGGADGSGSKGTFSAPGATDEAPVTIEAVAPIAPSAPAAGAGGETGEAYWRGRVTRAQAAVAAADVRVKQLEGEQARLQNEGKSWLVQADCTTSRRPLEGDLEYRERALREGKACAEKAKTYGLPGVDDKLAAAREEAVAARRELEETIPEEARRAGALPGWLR
jgi:hypothetical protein